MPTSTAKTTDNPAYAVVIEQEIGRVHWNPSGGEPMLVAAFRMIAEHVSDTAATEEPRTFTFTILDVSQEGNNPDRFAVSRLAERMVRVTVEA